jgi:hypothetical protein
MAYIHDIFRGGPGDMATRPRSRRGAGGWLAAGSLVSLTATVAAAGPDGSGTGVTAEWPLVCAYLLPMSVTNLTGPNG